jgi:hypothetical protein
MRFLEFIPRATSRTALGCLIALSACTTWEGAPPPPPAPSARDEIRGPIRVVRADGFAVVLHDAHVTGDTLYGYREGTGTRMAVPLPEVVTTQRRRIDPLRSLGALAAGAAVVLGAGALLVIHYLGGPNT